MKTLVAGATGATGRKLVDQLLSMKQQVRVIVRSKSRIPEQWKNNELVEVIEGKILELSDNELQHMVKGCENFVSCLGHRTNFKGTFMPPWRLITQSVKRLCEAIKAENPSQKVRFILMNSAANKITDQGEKWSLQDCALLTILRLFIPTILDIENSARYLRKKIGQDDKDVHWVVVRPFVLSEEPEVSSYKLVSSPEFSFVKSPETKTRRIDVANFMARLTIEDELWQEWKGKNPVIL